MSLWASSTELYPSALLQQAATSPRPHHQLQRQRLPVSVYVWLAQQLTFHVVGLLFEWLDRTGAARDFKVRDAERKPYRELLPRVLCNQVFVLLPCMVIAEQHLGVCFIASDRAGHVVTSLLGTVAILLGMSVGHDVVQYLSHRYILHQPNIRLMRFLRHSIHHSTGATKAISACYMSVPDFFLEIVLPYLVPLAILGGGGIDISFHCLVAGLGAVGGLYEHSGYDFSLGLRLRQTSPVNAQKPQRLFDAVMGNLLDNRSHSEHHMRSTVSFSDGFGSPGICDTLFATRWDLTARGRGEAAEEEWQRQRTKLA